MTRLYADIIIDISHEKLDRSFQYLIPEKLQDTLEPGMCVTVPFGTGNRQIKGYVVRITKECSFDPAKLKSIIEIAPKGVSVEEKMISLAGWIKRNYGSTMIQALKTVLPAKQSVKKLEHKTICRLVNREDTATLLGESIRKKQAAKERLLRTLLETETVPYEWVTGKLGVAPQTIHRLEMDGVIRVEQSTSFRDPVHLQKQEEMRLSSSPEQQRIVEEILQDFDKGKPGTYLIHGVTGSGKTHVYMEIIEQVIARGRQAILLIPEIALTYQTLLRFYLRFGNRVSVINSTLSPGERYDQCQRAKNGDIDIIIGPRSALFTPFPDLGVIIIDEEHESSYKSEGNPKYHARETAMEAARLHGAALVLGSATPSMEAYYRVKKGEIKLFQLHQRLTGGQLPTVSVVDLRQELKEGNRSIFSRRLQELLADRLKKGEQSILFINRRGYAGFISCRSCGHVMKCPHCDVSLSEHKNGMLMCHYCGYMERKPGLCPECGSRYISGFKAGTQQIEEKLKELFPTVRTLRMDADTTKTKDSYEKILASFMAHEADVLIGTQMIVKGHDFPLVTLVGVLAADLSLSVSDYRAGERTFQLLTQAVGRAGRGTLPGEAVIQTYQPDHYAVTYAAAQDYEGFFEEELLYREMGGYPPVQHLLAVQVFAKAEEKGDQYVKKLVSMAKEWLSEKGKQSDSDPRAVILGPSPAVITKINDIFRFVFYVKCKKYDTLVFCKDYLEDQIRILGEQAVTVQFDFDPMSTM